MTFYWCESNTWSLKVSLKLQFSKKSRSTNSDPAKSIHSTITNAPYYFRCYRRTESCLILVRFSCTSHHAHLCWQYLTHPRTDRSCKQATGCRYRQVYIRVLKMFTCWYSILYILYVIIRRHLITRKHLFSLYTPYYKNIIALNFKKLPMTHVYNVACTKK